MTKRNRLYDDNALPTVARLTFSGDSHVLCGNGQHFFWDDSKKTWVELAPLPESICDTKQKAERLREAERIANSERFARQNAAFYELQRQIADKKQQSMARDRSMSFEEIVFEEIQKENGINNKLLSVIASRSHSRWSRREIEQQIANMVKNQQIICEVVLNKLGVVRSKSYKMACGNMQGETLRDNA
jgi:hypothetical protein